jgi:hypothetical protein
MFGRASVEVFETIVWTMHFVMNQEQLEGYPRMLVRSNGHRCLTSVTAMTRSCELPKPGLQFDLMYQCWHYNRDLFEGNGHTSGQARVCHEAYTNQ